MTTENLSLKDTIKALERMIDGTGADNTIGIYDPSTDDVMPVGQVTRKYGEGVVIYPAGSAP